MQVKERKPLIVAFCCNWCSYAGADLSGTNSLNYPANVKIIRVPCSCRVNPIFILRAFQRGADGVIICGCHPGDCHYTSGNYFTRRRITLLYSMLDFLGIERNRTRLEWVSAAEGAKFAAVMNQFPNAKFAIEGHTDSTGNDKINDPLSQDRANAVRDYLISKGISANRLTAEGFGSKRPIDTNNTAAGRANNRRTEVRLIK